jgi:hypothetical protein
MPSNPSWPWLPDELLLDDEVVFELFELLEPAEL